MNSKATPEVIAREAKKAAKMEVRPIGARDYFFHIEAQNQFYGSLINVKYGEAFLAEGPLNAEVISELFHKKSDESDRYKRSGVE